MNEENERRLLLVLEDIASSLRQLNVSIGEAAQFYNDQTGHGIQRNEDNAPSGLVAIEIPGTGRSTENQTATSAGTLRGNAGSQMHDVGMTPGSGNLLGPTGGSKPSS